MDILFFLVFRAFFGLFPLFIGFFGLFYLLFFLDILFYPLYTEEKFENTIDRLSGKTKDKGLRSIERVPAGAVFNFEIVLDEYDSDNIEENKKIMQEAFRLLENDYIGGSGTRGYGHVGIVIDKDEDEELKIG